MATIVGVLTTDLGALESGRTAFVEDASGGIALYLDATVGTALPAGTRIRVQGGVDSRFAQRTLRIAESDVVVLDEPGVGAAAHVATGDALEPLEGRRLAVFGTAIGGSDALADGVAISIDDGSGPVRIVMTPPALGTRTVRSGDRVAASGPLGQRDSSGTGLSGYRLYVTASDDLTIEPEPTPTSTPTATPSPTPVPTPTPGPSPTPSPGVTPTPTPIPTPRRPDASPTPDWAFVSVATARTGSPGTVVATRGVVVAEGGRLGTPPLIAIADATGGIVVRVPSGTPALARGAVVEVRGPLAAPYGQLEIRPPTGGIRLVGSATPPTPMPVGAVDELTEGRLVQVEGRLLGRPSKATSGDITFVVETGAGVAIKVAADASSGVAAATLAVGAEYRIVGVAGQRASRSGALDGYRVWTRDARDLTMIASPATNPTPTPISTATPKPGSTSKPKPNPTASDGADPVSIAAATKRTDQVVTIEATVTAPATLLDATGRRIVVQDASGAIEVLLGKDATAPTVGSRVRVTGTVGTAYGAPRLRSTEVTVTSRGAGPSPLVVRARLTGSHTWRLVQISGRVEDVRKLGDRWRAELAVGNERIVVVGQAGSRIPAATLAEGRVATVVGIVRPAYPNAADRRPSVLPRSPGDIRVTGSATGTAPAGGGSTHGASGGTSGAGPATSTGDSRGGLPSASTPAIPDADLRDLAAFDGRLVRVGGLVTELTADGFRLDDGTAVGRVVLAGPAAEWLGLIEPADAINVIGRVGTAGGGPAVVVDDGAAISLGSDPNAVAAGGGGATGDPSASPRDAAAAVGDAPHAARAAGLAGDLTALPGAGAGLLTLVLVSLASVAVTLVRRQHARRSLAARVAIRLATITGTAPSAAASSPSPSAAPAGAPLAAPPVERGASVGHEW